VLFFLGDFVLSAAARVWEKKKHARSPEREHRHPEHQLQRPKQYV
jgi:hypothetical protein